MKNSKLFRGPFVWFLVLIIALMVTFNAFQRAAAPTEMTLSEFTQAVADNDIKNVELLDKSNVMQGERTGDDGVVVEYRVEFSDTVNRERIDTLLVAVAADGGEVAVSNEQSGVLVTLLFSLLPFVLIFGLFFFLMQSMQGGGGRGVMQFGKSKAKLVSKDAPKVTFADVAGSDEAVEELREIKEFLENPSKFQAMGAKIPKGVLLFGPPGTGKTLLARAVAGEAGVPFYSISGSDFVEMFVGVGASRVRDLFEQAKANAPSIIFMDEIDAVGRHRGAGMGGGHDEREQTLNQLLVEMDGFDQRSAVILIAATNRPDILDPALLRPGRFDRQITVDRPDLIGREAILKVHTRGKPISDEINLNTLARSTPGFTGADLANMINEAALLAARFGKSEISQLELEEAIERVIAGPERKTRLMSESEKRIVAYHESGHAIVGHALPQADPVVKISIIPRGRALGFTMSLPTEDKYLIARGELVDRLAVMLGGRVAEEIKIGDITTGAGDDIQRATATAKEMVTQYGMSERLGPMTLGQKDSQPFLGRDFGHQADYSGQVAAMIDDEVRHLIDEAHDEALEILVENAAVLESVAETLLDVETLAGDALAEAFKNIKKRPSRAVAAPNGKNAKQILTSLRRLDELGAATHNGSGTRKRAATRKTSTKRATTSRSTATKSTRSTKSTK